MTSDRAEIAEAITAIARILADDAYPAADRAELSSMHVDFDRPAAYWRLLMMAVPEAWRNSETKEAGWAAILQAMAIMTPFSHNPALPFGAALFRIKFTARRLQSLVSSGEDMIHIGICHAAQIAAEHGLAFDWADPAILLLSEDVAERREIRDRINRAYYAALQRADDAKDVAKDKP